MRGSFATKCLRDGVEIKNIAKVLGHKRIETTENYYIESSIDNLIGVSNSFEKQINIDINNTFFR